MLRIAICQLESHPAIHLGTTGLLEEPFVDAEWFLSTLRSVAAPVEQMQQDCKATYVSWQTRRLAGLFQALESLDFRIVVIGEGVRE